MNPIVSDGEGYVDQLDGLDLSPGEKLRVMWPTGAIEEHVICIDTVFTARKAYIEIRHFGAVAKLYLHGLRAERIK
jgi:hypothetical protein